MSHYFRELLDSPAFKKDVPWQIKHFEPEEVIIQEGEKNQYVYLVLEGVVSVKTGIQLLPDDRKNAGIAKLLKNEIFGELSMFDDQVHSATIIAASPCEIAEIDAKALNKFMDSNPDYGYRILRYLVNLLVKRMRHSNIRSNSILAWYLRECDD